MHWTLPVSWCFCPTDHHPNYFLISHFCLINLPVVPYCWIHWASTRIVNGGHCCCTGWGNCNVRWPHNRATAVRLISYSRTAGLLNVEKGPLKMIPYVLLYDSRESIGRGKMVFENFDWEIMTPVLASVLTRALQDRPNLSAHHAIVNISNCH